MNEHVTLRCVSRSARRLLKQTEAPAAAPEQLPRLLLHQIEAHGEQRQTADEVQRAENQLLLRRPRVEARAGHEVAEADRRQRDEAEVRSDEKVPLGFPEAEHERAEADVAEDQSEAHVQRNVHLQPQLDFYSSLSDKKTINQSIK